MPTEPAIARVKTVAATTWFTLALVCGVEGGVIYNSFAPEDGFGAGCSDPVGAGPGDYTRLAVPFTVLAPAQLDSVIVAMSHIEGPNHFRLTIQPDQGGEPGSTVLETLDVMDFLSDGSTRLALSALRPRLEAGAYWVVAQQVQPVSNSMRWHCSPLRVYGRAYHNNSNGGWLVDLETTYALRVNGTLVDKTLPQLRIATEGERIVMTWPTIFGDFTLEENNTLGNENSWTPVPETPTMLGNEQSVRVPLSTGSRFYRMRRP